MVASRKFGLARRIAYSYLWGIVLLLLATLLANGSIYPDRIYLKNGDRITGKIWFAGRNYILIEPIYGIYRIPRRLVRRTVYRKLAGGRVFLRLKTDKEIQGILLRIDTVGISVKFRGKNSFFPWKDIKFAQFWKKEKSMVQNKGRGRIQQ